MKKMLYFIILYVCYPMFMYAQVIENMIVSVNRYHRSARIGTIIAEEPVPL